MKNLNITERAVAVNNMLNRGEWMNAWDWLSNPANKKTRSGVRAVYHNAPKVRATIKAWHTWVNKQSGGALEKELLEKEKRQQQKQLQIDHKIQLSENISLSESGPQWKNNGIIYPHARAFLKYLVSNGYLYSSNRGVVKITHIDGRFMKPMRNKHMNAAIRLFESVDFN